MVRFFYVYIAKTKPSISHVHSSFFPLYFTFFHLFLYLIDFSLFSLHNPPNGLSSFSFITRDGSTDLKLSYWKCGSGYVMKMILLCQTWIPDRVQNCVVLTLIVLNFKPA